MSNMENILYVVGAIIVLLGILFLSYVNIKNTLKALKIEIDNIKLSITNIENKIAKVKDLHNFKDPSIFSLELKRLNLELHAAQRAYNQSVIDYENYYYNFHYLKLKKENYITYNIKD